MRIASLSPAATEVLFALGAGKSIVCTDQFSNFPEETKALPHLRDHQNIDANELRKFKPDLVITETIIQAELAERLRREEFSVVHLDPRRLADVFGTFSSLGILVEKEEAARALTAKLIAEMTTLKKRAALLGSRPKVYIEEWHDPPMASGNWVPELILAAGGTPFPIPVGELSREVTLEEVRRFDPDLILISWCGAGTFAKAELLLKRDGWQELRAIKNKKVKVIDDSLLNRPGPRVMEGAKRIYSYLFETMHS